MCPECGTAWRLPAQNLTPARRGYGLEFISAGCLVLAYAIFLSWFIQGGEPLKSFPPVITFIGVDLAVYLILRRWIEEKIMMYHIIPVGQALLHGTCPACNALIGEKMTNSDGITTCPECGAAWKLSDAVKQP